MRLLNNSKRFVVESRSFPLGHRPLPTHLFFVLLPLRLCLSPQFPCARVPTQPGGQQPQKPIHSFPPPLDVFVLRGRGKGEKKGGGGCAKRIGGGEIDPAGRKEGRWRWRSASAQKFPSLKLQALVLFPSRSVTTKLRRRSLRLFDGRRGGKTAACILYPIACRFFTLLLRYTLVHARSLLRFSRSAFQAPPTPTP